MRDRAAERRLGRASRGVDMDELVVPGHTGEAVDQVLGDLVPVGQSDFLADPRLDILDREGAGWGFFAHRPHSCRCRRGAAWPAASYSRASRATSSAAGLTSLIAPMPWPEPQMSFHAFASRP